MQAIEKIVASDFLSSVCISTRLIILYVNSIKRLESLLDLENHLIRWIKACLFIILIVLYETVHIDFLCNKSLKEFRIIACFNIKVNLINLYNGATCNSHTIDNLRDCWRIVRYRKFNIAIEILKWKYWINAQCTTKPIKWYLYKHLESLWYSCTGIISVIKYFSIIIHLTVSLTHIYLLLATQFSILSISIDVILFPLQTVTILIIFIKFYLTNDCSRVKWQSHLISPRRCISP